MKRLVPSVETLVAAGMMLAVLAIGGTWQAVVLTGAASVGVVFGLRRWHVGSARTPRRALGRAARGIVVVVAAWTAVSFVTYVRHDNGDTLSERAATWGRDHHLGGVIDFLETRMYSTPPSKLPAKRLALSPTLVVTTPGVESRTAAPAAPAPADTASATVAGATASGAGTVTPASTSTTITTTTDSGPPPPAPPTPLAPLFSPALPGEGQWTPIASAGGQDAMWATSIRPFAAAGGVVASMVVIDQTHLRTGLFNGAEEPGGTWVRGNRVPVELQPALIAAMNGGFRFEHIKGGYKTEGVTVKPLRDGDATLAVGRDGRVVIGQLGRDLVDDGSWISLRQNLVLIVDGGQSQVQRGIREGVWWGADYGNEVYVPRSAVCEMADGRIAYALVGKVDAAQLAESLIAMGCVKAMQMDINGTWPVFFTFATGADGAVTSHFLDNRMGGNPQRYLTGSTKEFFAFFDATRVPAQSVLDR